MIERAGLAFLLLAACTSGPSEAECTARLGRLQAKLALLENIDSSHPLGPEVAVAPLVAVSRPLTEFGPLVELRADEVLLDARKVGKRSDAGMLAQLKSDLETLDRHHDVLHPGDPSPFSVYVVAPGDLVLSELLAVRGAFPRPDAARLVVRNPARPLPDPVPLGASVALRKRIAAIRVVPRDERSTPLAALTVEGRGQCGPVASVYHRVANANPADKDDILLAGLVPGVQACQCRKVDIDALEASTVLVLLPEGPPAGWLPLPSEITLPPTATVAQLAAALERAERR